MFSNREKECVNDSENDNDDDMDMEFYDSESATYLNTLLKTVVPGQEYLTAVYKPIDILLSDNNVITTDRVLFDTGALHTSESFVKKNYELFLPYLIPKESRTTLADHKTSIVMEHMMYLNVKVQNNNGIDIIAKLPFWLFPMTGNDIIIGLPAILRHFISIFLDMLQDASAAMDGNLSNLLSNVTAAADLINPWTKTFLPAPEDDLDEPPSSFPTFIANMNTSIDIAIKEYQDKLEKHVMPEFISGTSKPVMTLLRTKGEKVFIPDLEHWRGIQGFPPLLIELVENAPTLPKPKPIYINKRILEAVKCELERLCKYMYEPSTSQFASSMVPASKETEPWIRICGNYKPYNPYFKRINHPTKHPVHELAKISNFKVFVNADLTNGFHQVQLDVRSRELLSIVTPFGQFQPKFLPEGIAPATNALQYYMDMIFKDFEEWIIVIFDNILVMGHDYDDLYDKLDIFLDHCIKHNLRLKLSKTWFGQTEVDFFGYICRYQSYRLSDSRKQSILEIPMPNSLTQMKSFLGSANFFRSFMPNFSILTAPLTDMVKKNFNWSDKVSWQQPYDKIFSDFKSALSAAVEIFYPDFELDWTLRTDASQVGVGAVLFMTFTRNDGSIEFRPVGFLSHKFSPAAQSWSTIEQECFACYFAIKGFQYLLRCKQFVLETDHRNLLWMEKSDVPKIIRWCVFMQSFDFKIRHIPGSLNNLPDYLSRSFSHIYTAECNSIQTLLYNICIFSNDEEGRELRSLMDTLTLGMHFIESDNIEEVLKTVHNSRRGHWGISRTMSKLDEDYPGHEIPYKVVADFIQRCSICQKERLGMQHSLKPIYRHLKPLHKRSTIGIDDLTITPADKYGNSHLIVIVIHYTRLVWAYPCATCSEETVASALLIFFSIYGLFEVVMSDPGTAIMAKGVEQLNKFLGYQEHRVSLVDRHTSNGVETPNREILRHIRALCYEERIIDRWSAPTVLPVILFIINSSVNSETGMIPFHAHFGTAEATYFKMPELMSPEENCHEFVRLLNEDLKILSEASKKHQDKLVSERLAKTPTETQNKYVKGDLVLWLAYDGTHPRDSKLSPRYKGPYEVISHYKNDVKAKHINMGNIITLDSLRLKRFLGTYEEAKKTAMIDQEQFLINTIKSYKGNPYKRSTMEFLVKFEDNTEVWKPYDKDLSDTIQFEDYCRSNSELLPLLHKLQDSQRIITALRQQPINLVVPGDIVYVKLRHWGYEWYDGLNIPDQYEKEYVVKGVYRKYVGKVMKKISIYFQTFRQTYVVDNEFVTLWGKTKTLASNHIEVTPEVVSTYAIKM
jgi:RNase H-like domain found in reverse transcriptase/Reverse transcriptase (RNA-dependent DNA polymerase)/Integrase zinc binding domain